MVYEGKEGQLVQTGGYGEDRQFSYMWVLALVLIFFALIFWRRDDKRHDAGYESLIPAMAIGTMHKNGGYQAANDSLNHREHWDTLMMSMQQFGDIKKEIVSVGHQNAMDTARYFYENRAATDRGFFDQAMLTQQVRHDSALGFKDGEIQGMRNTGEIRKDIADLRSELKDKEIQQLVSKVNYFETVLGIRGLGAIPSYPVAGPTPMTTAYMHAAPAHC